MTKWWHVRAAPGMGMKEQWIFKPDKAPLCSLRRAREGDGWQGSLLCLAGISTTVLEMPGAFVLEQAQRMCEWELRLIGWKWEKRRPSRDGQKT